MSQNYTRHLLSIVCLILVTSITSSAQKDNPNIDQIPPYLKKIHSPSGPPKGPVIINDWDNWNIGVDFAETHITMNPQNALNSFAAWNVSGNAGGKGWGTINGLDWFSSNPAWGNGPGDIVLATDSLGNIFFSTLYGSAAPSGSKISVSNDQGATWSTPVIALSGTDKDWIAADQTNGPYSNYVYATMTGSTNQGVLARSTDHGATWQQTAVFTTQSLPGMYVCVGPNGNIQGGSVYVVTNSGSGTASTYTFYKSTDGGLTFVQKSAQNWAGYVGTQVAGRHSVDNMRTRPYPFIAADNSHGLHRGRLYCVYASNTPAGDAHKPDIFCRYSDDGGTTWSGAVTVNDDVNTTANHNFFPAIWCEKNTGRLYIQWMDTRDTPTSDSALIYATFSDNGGVTFAPNQAVSNKKMKINCTTCPSGGSPAYQGDYNGIAANPYGAILSWTDFRDGSFADYVAYFPDFAMRLTPPVDTLLSVADYLVTIPGVKLYTDTVFLEASINATPGTLNINFPMGNKLWNYPGSLPIEITSNGNATPGTYTLTVIAHGTPGTPIHKRTANLKVFAPGTPFANFTADHYNTCVGQGVNFFDQSTGPATSWQWTFQNGNPSTSTLPNPSNIQFNTAGQFDVTLIVSNAQGTDTITKINYVTTSIQGPAPLVFDTTVCQGGPAPVLHGVGQNLRWYTDTALTQMAGTGNLFITNKTLPGTYTYYATQSPASCESTAAIAVLTIKPGPIVHFNDTILCAGHTLTLNASVPNALTYLWQPGNQTSPGIQVDTSGHGLSQQTISVYITNSFGCAYGDTVVVSFSPCADIHEIGKQFTCKIYPNPASGLLNLELRGKAEKDVNILIYSYNGKLVYESGEFSLDGTLEKTIDLTNVSEGIYILDIMSGKLSAGQQIVIQK